MKPLTSLLVLAASVLAHGQSKPKSTSPTRPMPMPPAAKVAEKKETKEAIPKARRASAALAAGRAATANIREYLRRITDQTRDKALNDVRTRSDWERQRPLLQRQLLDMLGLDPMPERGDLRAVVTGKVNRPGMVVEKLHFQSSPGLYVTANFYRPEKVDRPLPTILYLCGHHKVVVDGRSCGNKTHYQHHGTWFARNGYCCLTIDTLQLGEVEGEHHGTYRLGKWWWFARGYTPAGVEAWNATRALDYLATRPEVDMTRLGVTGRSGGGIYSWWLAAIDDRPKCIAPVAGITDLENYVVDDCIEGHCDCMFLANAYGWDYPMVAALAAPRPVLFCNSDKDRIFPLSGVERSHAKLRAVYDAMGATDKLGLTITEGPHSDTQELQVPVFRWMNRWLRNENGPVHPVIEPRFAPTELRVFDQLPKDAVNARIDESFVSMARIGAAPSDPASWQTLRERLLSQLKATTFRRWPEKLADLAVERTESKISNGQLLEAYEFTSEENLRMPLYMVRGEAHASPKIVVVNVVDEAGWKDWLASLDRDFGEVVPEVAGSAHHPESGELRRRLLQKNPWAFVTVPPRGVGPTKWELDDKKAVHLPRRFYLLGKTIDDGRVWDVRRAVQALATMPTLSGSRIWLQSDGTSAGIALYAGIYESRVERLDLHRLPKSHREGPIFLNVLRTLDMPQAVALAYPKRVILYDVNQADFAWSMSIANLLKLPKSPLEFRKMPAANGK